MSQSWSGLRKALETEYLCPALRGRVQYFITHYRAAHDEGGRLAIRVDGKEGLKADPYNYYVRGYDRLTAQRKREQNIPMRAWNGKEMLHEAENERIENEVRREANQDGVFEIYHVTDALRRYTSTPIDESLTSGDPLVRLFAVLDRRVGKRTLAKLAEYVGEQPERLRFFYRLRLDAEGISHP